jgi:cobalt-zinc-cadmium efflux system outer membrane protein
MAAVAVPAATNSLDRIAMPTRVTLEEVKRLAFEHNWDLLAAHSDVDIATALRLVSKEFPNPTLTLGTTKISTDSNPQSTPAGNTLWHRNYDTVAAISQLLEIGGKRGYRQSSAAAGVRAAENRLQDARRLLDEAVTTAYVSTILADENVKIFRQSAASLRREAEIAQRRLGAGDIAESEKSQIEIAAERLELDANTAATNAVQARVSLEVLVGVSQPRGDWTPGEDLASLVAEARLADLNRAEPMGLRPDVAAAEALVEKTTSDLHLQRAMRIPDPTVSLQYEHEPPDQPNTVGLSVSFPLPLWNRNRGNIRAATAARDQAEILAGRVRAQAAAQLASARLAYLDALHRWTRYRDELTPKSGKVRETVAFAYGRGGASLLDLLSAERNDNEIRLATAQAMADTASKAATLRSALNLPSRDTPTHTP